MGILDQQRCIFMNMRLLLEECMLAKMTTTDTEYGTATTAKGYDSRAITWSTDQAMAFAKWIAAYILSDIQICGSYQTLDGLSIKLNRAQAIIQIQETHRAKPTKRLHD